MKCQFSFLLQGTLSYLAGEPVASPCLWSKLTPWTGAPGAAACGERTGATLWCRGATAPRGHMTFPWSACIPPLKKRVETPNRLELSARVWRSQPAPSHRSSWGAQHLTTSLSSKVSVASHQVKSQILQNFPGQQAEI